MRRFTFTIVTSMTALALLPAGALARDHAQHHQRQHERRHHHVHHAGVRHERFGAVTNAASSGGSSNLSATGSPPATENAGTVQSFSDGVLTLALANGSKVSGTVDNGTQVECEAADTGDMRADGDRGSGHGGGDNGDRGGDNGDRGDDDGNDNRNCMSADLVTGAIVRSAELRISSAGAIWDRIELIG